MPDRLFHDKTSDELFITGVGQDSVPSHQCTFDIIWSLRRFAFLFHLREMLHMLVHTPATTGSWILFSVLTNPFLSERTIFVLLVANFSRFE